MKLYYAPGACSMGAHIVLREVGGPFELDRVDLQTKLTEGGRDFRTVNPKGSVPALVTDDGDLVTEGPAIVQFIAESKGARSLVAEPGTIARARVQEMLNFTSSELRSAFGPLFQPGLPDDQRKMHATNVGTKLDWLERVLSDGRSYLAGEVFTVADAYAFAVTGFAYLHRISLDPWPRLSAFMARVAARPAVRSAMQAEGLVS